MSCSRVDVLDGNHKETCAEIDNGLMILLGRYDDTEADARYIADKTANLRIFEDDAGKLNLSVKDVGGSILLVSNSRCMPMHEMAAARLSRQPPLPNRRTLYLHTAELLRGHGLNVQTGHFQTHMQVSLCNDGPVACCWTRKNCFDENPAARYSRIKIKWTRRQRPPCTR